MAMIDERANVLLRSALRFFDQEQLAEDIDGIQHWLDHDEYGLAFEALVLTAATKNVELPCSMKSELHGLGISLGLNNESVLHPSFWDYVRQFFEMDSQNNGRDSCT